MVRWADVRTLYLRETRAALRERTIVTNSILVPVFLYPFMLWVMFTGMTFAMGQTEGFVSRVLVREWPAAHPGLRRALEADRRLEIRDRMETDPAALVRAGQLDAVLDLRPAEDGALPGNFTAHVTYDKSKERSAGARDRLQAALARYRDDWLAREAAARGVDAAAWRLFTVERRNVASGREMGTLLVGMMLPLFFVVMVAVGCFYPAVDSTAGERERNTWETTLSTAASRESIVVAKYLYVASFGCLAGVLNMTAMLVTMKPLVAPMLAGRGEVMEFAVPLVSLPVLVVAAGLLAGFIAAGMMLFAAFARTFKEGQAMITPFYMLILMPSMLLNVPGLELSTGLALVPIANVTMVVREALSGIFHWPQIALTVIVDVALIAALLKVAAAVIGSEDVVMGSYGRSFPQFFRERVLRRGARGSREVSP